MSKFFACFPGSWVENDFYQNWSKNLCNTSFYLLKLVLKPLQNILYFNVSAMPKFFVCFRGSWIDNGLNWSWCVGQRLRLRVVFIKTGLKTSAKHPLFWSRGDALVLRSWLIRFMKIQHVDYENFAKQFWCHPPDTQTHRHTHRHTDTQTTALIGRSERYSLRTSKRESDAVGRGCLR